MYYKVDTLQNFLDARYISPPEACDRMMGNDIAWTYPPVQTLAVHTEDNQQILMEVP